MKKINLLFLTIFIVIFERSYEMRIFNGVVAFFRSLFMPKNDFEIDGYVVSLQWVRKIFLNIAFSCLNYNEFCRISPSTANRFSIHGLWPQAGKSPISYCLNEKFNPYLIQPLLVEKLNYHWPSLRNFDRNNIRFLSHEYEKHGTCLPFEGDLRARMNNYFYKAVSIFESLDSNRYMYEVANGNISLYNFLRLNRIEAKIICKKQGNDYLIEEIRFYLDKNFRFVPYLGTRKACKNALLKPY